MKKLLLLALFALPTMATAANDIATERLVEFKHLNQRIVELEKALRLQTLTTQAVRQDNYDLACKAQKEATTATHNANVRDVNGISDMQFAEICTVSKATTKTTPSWLQPKANSDFEPAGILVENK